jgi:hypothetical protein
MADVKLEQHGSMILVSAPSPAPGTVYVSFSVQCEDEGDAQKIVAEQTSPAVQSVLCEMMQGFGTAHPAGTGNRVIRGDIVLARIEQKRRRGA